MKTGDLGFLDGEGYLHLTGRAKDLIIRGGVNISPVEIDGVLMQRPEVVEAAPSACRTSSTARRWWPSSCCGRVRASAPTTSCAIAHAALPAFKAPKRIVLSDALPKTERGKLDRKALVELWNRGNA